MDKERWQLVEVGPINSVSRVPLARSGFAFSSHEADLHSLSGAQGHSQTTEGTSQWAPPLWWTFKRCSSSALNERDITKLNE